LFAVISGNSEILSKNEKKNVFHLLKKCQQNESMMAILNMEILQREYACTLPLAFIETIGLLRSRLPA
jgi:hypothetical protein